MRWLIIEGARAPGSSRLRAVVTATGRQKALKVIQKHHGGGIQHASRVPVLIGSDLGSPLKAYSLRERPEFTEGGEGIYAE